MFALGWLAASIWSRRDRGMSDVRPVEVRRRRWLGKRTECALCRLLNGIEVQLADFPWSPTRYLKSIGGSGRLQNGSCYNTNLDGRSAKHQLSQHQSWMVCGLLPGDHSTDGRGCVSAGPPPPHPETLRDP